MVNKILLVVIYLAFISLGLPDGVFGVAWPDMRVTFGMPLQMAGIVSILLMSCSAISSFASGKILRRFGTAKVTFISCLMTAIALWGYGAAPSFAWIIIFAIPLGFGQGAVDSGLNNYVANNYSSRHMSWLHCCWGIGASLGPFIMTKTLAVQKSWRSGYTTISVIQISLAAIFFMSLKLWKEEKNDNVKEEIKVSSKHKSAGFKSFTPWLGVIIFFIYTGTEYCVGLWTNSMLVESRNIPKETAGLWIAYYYGALMIGRFVTGIIVNKLGNRTLVRLGLIIATIGTLMIYFSSISVITMLGIMIVGFGFGPIYPCTMHETPKRFDEGTTRVLIGYQVGAACLGGSFLSAALGVLFSKTTLELLPVCLFILLISMIVVSEILNRRT